LAIPSFNWILKLDNDGLLSSLKVDFCAASRCARRCLLEAKIQRLEPLSKFLPKSLTEA
jgi:hypothetical protein